MLDATTAPTANVAAAAPIAITVLSSAIPSYCGTAGKG
jgi:hypothetical protein